ncbi:MAG: proteasome subunit beta [Candidatus Hermodarchaeia archaeon]|jgi:proteasome beta subunit
MSGQIDLTPFFGAATVGITFENGVVIGAEKRVLWGYTVVSKTGKKIFPITDSIVVGSAGVSGDYQMLSSFLVAESSLFELENRRSITVNAAAQLLSNILFSRKYMPYLTQTLIGGVDSDGSHLYSLDLAGSLIEETYAAVGTATSLVLGVLEANFRKDLTKEETIQLAVKAIRSATRRDAMSGEGIDLLIVTPEGIESKHFPIAE